MKTFLILGCIFISLAHLVRSENSTNASTSNNELFGSEEFDVLYAKGRDALKIAVRERLQQKLNQTIEQKDAEMIEMDEKLMRMNEDIDRQPIRIEDYNKFVCAMMLIRWHIAEEFKENVVHEKPQCQHVNESIGLWTAYVERGCTKVANSLREALKNDSTSHEKFAFSMTKMYKLCDAYMHTVPEAMRIIDEYKARLRPLNEMLELYGTRGPSHHFLLDDMTYVNMLMAARGVDGIGWSWVNETIGFVKPQAPSVENCVNLCSTEKPLMQ